MKSQKSKKIFIVDADPFWRAVLKQILKELGYTYIIEFENGKDCLENLSLNPQIVFLDDQMKDMDGLTVLRKIKTYFSGMGVVFCSAHQHLGLTVTAMEFGSIDYLLKENTSKNELASMMENLIKNEVGVDEIY
ncbi:MAG: response regulator [Ferruginibacter sp.]